MFVPFADKLPSGEWEVFADGFAGEGPIRSVGEARFRPMGLAEGPDGSLYVSDSRQGRIWRIRYEPTEEDLNRRTQRAQRETDQPEP
jgi:glucose/arabinose dehydrogenase